MEDFTGGLAESIDLKKAPKELFKQMEKACALHSLMGCSIEVSNNSNRDFTTRSWDALALEAFITKFGSKEILVYILKSKRI